MISGSGGSRTHSIAVSETAWSASCLPSRVVIRCPRRESNPQTLGFKPSRSASWRTWALLQVIPDGLEPSLPGCEARSRCRWTTGSVEVDSPGIAPGSPACDAGIFLLDHEPVLFVLKRKPWDSNSQRCYPPPVFKTGSSSGRMTSNCFQVAGAGIEPTSRRSERRILPLNDPARFVSRETHRSSNVRQLRGQESNLRTRGSKPRISTSRNYPASLRGTGGTRTHDQCYGQLHVA